MKRLAIVSSYNEECGAAFYSSRLKKHLETAGYHVDVLRLPVSLLRISTPSAIRRKGDQEIARIAREAQDFDAVLLQFEPGLYGTTPRSSYNRVKQILSSARRAIVTVHGFDRHVGLTSFTMAGFYASTLRPRAAWHEITNRTVSTEVQKFWRYVRDARNVTVLTFCKADQVLLQRFFDLPRIDNFPITYFDQEEVASIRQSVDRERFLQQFGLDPRKKYFAVCGFLSAYKGHLTAMKALEFLPEDWNLAIVGGEHPHGIEADRDIGNYLRQLLAFAIEAEKPTISDNLLQANGLGALLQGEQNRVDIREQLFKRSDFKYFLPQSELASRIKFLGQVSDSDMPKFYAALDYVVHPYTKTKSGQSGSGPATMAVEFGAKSLFTNVPVFREMNQYFTDAMHFFNVGNFVELAESLERYNNFEPALAQHRSAALEVFNPAAMVEKYRSLMEA